jgi:phosphocarrier protein
MAQFNFVVNDPVGIHARPAGQLVKKLSGFKSDITITRGSDSCSGKKLLALMKMQIKHGETITVKTEGPDADEAAKEAEAFLKANF